MKSFRELREERLATERGTIFAQADLAVALVYRGCPAGLREDGHSQWLINFNAAQRGGMLTMYEDGMRKAIRGDTTFEEVLRVTREN